MAGRTRGVGGTRDTFPPAIQLSGEISTELHQQGCREVPHALIVCHGTTPFPRNYTHLPQCLTTEHGVFLATRTQFPRNYTRSGSYLEVRRIAIQNSSTQQPLDSY